MIILTNPNLYLWKMMSQAIVKLAITFKHHTLLLLLLLSSLQYRFLSSRNYFTKWQSASLMHIWQQIWQNLDNLISLNNQLSQNNSYSVFFPNTDFPEFELTSNASLLCKCPFTPWWISGLVQTQSNYNSYN